MKKTKLFLIIFLGFILSCQVDWIEKNEKLIENIERNSKLVKKIDTIENFINLKIQFLETDDKSKIEFKTGLGNVVKLDLKLYKNDSFIFAENSYSIEALKDKRKRNDDEPIGEIIEKNIYYKNKKSGVQKTRKIPFYNFDDIPNLKLELLKKEYEIIEIGEKGYLESEKSYNGLMSVIKKY
ncbi:MULTISPECIES: hypothetical protein [Flavobacteriaceae]|uniref:Lipoprotein n=2 Tax=Flavobacteriaceae TaxID=49546 RepID=A0A4Y8ASE4_9FLAO|nr:MULTISPECIES: hypothetical protein [Flavobacteriaceae]TEW74113.1 hypothetical protein E2488_11620 [Gramella jeungdoensis]GGK40399.1 hypothetical protein GCM10007963_05580 [Lutibacter litoralis]